MNLYAYRTGSVGQTNGKGSLNVVEQDIMLQLQALDLHEMVRWWLLEAVDGSQWFLYHCVQNKSSSCNPSHSTHSGSDEVLDWSRSREWRNFFLEAESSQYLKHQIPYNTHRSLEAAILKMLAASLVGWKHQSSKVGVVKGIQIPQKCYSIPWLLINNGCLPNKLSTNSHILLLLLHPFKWLSCYF